MKMKMTALLLALCLLLSLLAGCGEVEDVEKITEENTETAAAENSADDREGRGRVILGIPYEMPVAVRLVDRYNLFSEDKVEIKVCDGKDKLNLAVLSGEVDMIACQEADTMTRYAVNGYLEPLENLIGGDFNTEKCFENVVELCTAEGHLVMLPSLVSITGMYLPQTIVEAADGGFTDMKELIETLDGLDNQKFYKRLEKETVLDNFIIHGFSSWLDMENRTCRFEDEDFIALLEFCSRFAEDYDEVQANRSGAPSLFDPLFEVQRPDQVINPYRYEDSKGSESTSSQYGLAAKLFPSPSGSWDKKYGLKPEMLYAVHQKSTVKKSAAAFLQWMLSEEMQEEIVKYEEGAWGMPITYKAFDNLVERIVTSTDSEGNVIGYSIYSEDELRARCAEGKAILASADHFIKVDAPIADIVKEEGTRYLHGEITAEKAAAYIQNRVQLYLDEQG